jgi:hypothetical protein
LVRIRTCGGAFDMMSTSFFLGRQKLIPRKEQPGGRAGQPAPDLIAKTPRLMPIEERRQWF